MDFENDDTGRVFFALPDKEFCICAAVGNFLLCMTGIVAAPLLVQFTRLHMDVRGPALFSLALTAVVLACIFLSALGYFAERQIHHGQNRSFKTHLKRMSAFLLLLLCFYLIYFLICGSLSSIIYFIFRNTLSYVRIKTVIDIMTSLITVAVIPVILMQLLSFSLSSLPLRSALRAGLKGLRMGYLKLLLTVIVLMLAGGLLTWLISLAGSRYIQVILEIIAFTILGGISTCIIYETGIRIYAGGRRK